MVEDHESRFSVDASTVESTRYALIRRLAYVFRHHLVVNLQPLGMISQLMHHRLNATPLDISAMRDSVDQVNRLARKSIDSCLDVVSWLTADPHVSVSVRDAVSECLANVRSSFSFRGFVIRYEETSLEALVSQVALREVLTATLIAVTDHAKGLGEIVISVRTVSNGMAIAIQMRSSAHESSAEQDAYRLLAWDDVQILASFHGMQFAHVSDEHVQIRVVLSI